MPHTWTAKSYSFPLAPHLSLIQECSLPRSPASLFLILEKQIRWKDYINFENKVFFCFCFFFKLTYYFNWRLITLQYCSGFCHTLTWISHGCTCVPHPERPSHMPPLPIPLGHPSAPAPSTLSHALNLDWQSVSYMMIYMFQCYSFQPYHPSLLPQSPKDCSLHLCLFCCIA